MSSLEESILCEIIRFFFQFGSKNVHELGIISLWPYTIQTQTQFKHTLKKTATFTRL